MFILHIAVILHYLWIKDIYSGGIVSSHILDHNILTSHPMGSKIFCLEIKMFEPKGVR